VAGGGTATGKLASDDKTNLSCTKTHGTRTKRKLRRGETHPETWDGERSGGEGDRAAGAELQFGFLGRRCRGEEEI
jgi:hypothetical protein